MKSGRSIVERALPYLIERIRDHSVPDETLSPFERAIREWRQRVIEEKGGLKNWNSLRLWLLNSTVGTWTILQSIDSHVFKLAAHGGLVNKRSRRVFSIVLDRQRIADSLTKQLAALGLDGPACERLVPAAGRTVTLTPEVAQVIQQEIYGISDDPQDTAPPRKTHSEPSIPPELARSIQEIYEAGGAELPDERT